jgi:hypothetical protein
MRFWLREVAGWGLVAIGLIIFVLVYGLCAEKTASGEPHPRYVEAMTMTVIGIFVFRGGINVLKTAVAARVCQEVEDRLYPAPVPPVRPTAAQRPIVPPAQSRTPV